MRAAGSMTAAETTRAAGAFAWQLGLPRPSYQQIRVLRRVVVPGTFAGQTSRGRLVLKVLGDVVNWVGDYPGMGLGKMYRQYYRYEHYG